jgi:hypothetical protein
MKHFCSTQFSWTTWRNGSIISILKIPHREPLIIANKNIIRKYAEGFCLAEYVPFKPKQNNVAVMFFTQNEGYWWTHLTNKEFTTCFPELKHCLKNTKN